MNVPSEERNNFYFTYKKNWKITEETNFEFWKNELKPPYFVENIINNGYIMPFTTIPSPFRSSNNKSSLHHPQFVSQAITKLLQNNCVEEHKQKLYCCNALTESGGKKLHILF